MEKDSSQTDILDFPIPGDQNMLGWQVEFLQNTYLKMMKLSNVSK